MARICIVEDEESIANLLEINLNIEGHDTESYADGKSALETIRAKKFDLIFTSPPYYTLERYTQEDNQSWKKYKKLCKSYI